MKFVFLFISLLTFGPAVAQKANYAEYEGRSMVAVSYGSRWDANKSFKDTFDLPISAFLLHTTNGRVSMSLKSEMVEGCIGFNLKVLGESDGFGNYDLFASRKDYLENNILGTMTMNGKELFISIADLNVKSTKGRNGHDCQWDFGPNFYIEMTHR